MVGWLFYWLCKSNATWMDGWKMCDICSSGTSAWYRIKYRLFYFMFISLGILFVFCFPFLVFFLNFNSFHCTPFWLVMIHAQWVLRPIGCSYTHTCPPRIHTYTYTYTVMYIYIIYTNEFVASKNRKWIDAYTNILCRILYEVYIYIYIRGKQ